MSYPKLGLTGSVANRTITGIGVIWPSDSSGQAKPAYINRLQSSVRRVFTKDNVNSGTGPYKNAVPYDRVRLVHTFVGYIDVLTQSVVRSNLSTAQERMNVDLLESAVILENSFISFSYKYFSTGSQGIGNLSDGDSYEQGEADAPNWTYKIESGTPSTINTWLIKDHSISDQGNNVSRVQFTFEAIQAQLNLPSIIEGT